MGPDLGVVKLPRLGDHTFCHLPKFWVVAEPDARPYELCYPLFVPL